MNLVEESIRRIALRGGGDLSPDELFQQIKADSEDWGGTGFPDYWIDRIEELCHILLK